MDLAQTNACMACHAKDRQVVRPAFAYATRTYAALKAAEATLATNIKYVM